MSTFGEELRQRRLAAGLSLGDFARHIHYSKGYLSKVENGEKPPTFGFAKFCDAALGTGGTLTTLVSSSRSASGGATHVNDPLPMPAGVGSAFEALLDADNQRPALRAAADLDATAVVFGAIFEQCKELGHQISPIVVLDVVERHARILQSLARAAGDAAHSRQLLLLTARFAEYAGWMAQETGDENGAAHWTESAAQLAALAGDDDLVQFAYVRHADLALHRDDAVQTVSLAKRAQADGRVAARVRGLAAQREAQGHALAGDHEACMSCLDRASILLESSTANDSEPLLGSTVSSALSGLIKGWALYDLGLPRQAAEVLDILVPQIPRGTARSYARYGIRRVLAHVAADNVDFACQLAFPLIAIAECVDSATIRTDLRRLNRELTRRRSHPGARELHPLVRTALASGRSL